MFLRLFPMMGNFHMTRGALRCAGKYLRGSGIEDAFIECRIFGPKTLETVLNGSHYYRSFSGLIIVADAVTRMKMEAFWNENPSNIYEETVSKLEKFQQALCNNYRSASKFMLDEVSTNKDVLKLLEDIDNFTDDCSKKSTQCNFWENFVRIMDIIKNEVRSDRDGDIFLGMHTMKELLPIFKGGDGINYLRYG